MKLPDSAFFLVYAISEAEHTFYEAAGPTFQEVFPSPTCASISVDAYDSESPESSNGIVNFILGKDFTDDLSVWVGTLKCKTSLR